MPPPPRASPFRSLNHPSPSLEVVDVYTPPCEKLNLATKELTKVLSDNELFRKHEYEMEGIDFWDLRDRGLGLLHVYGNYMSLEEKGIRSFDPPSEAQH